MTRKNIYRREESARVRVERVIAGYLEYKYPKIYEEAHDFYEHLNEIYPEKKDLRRSNEFEWIRNGAYGKMKKFYTKKKKAVNMVLNIELMGKDTCGKSQETSVTLEASQETSMTLEANQETSVTLEASQETSMLPLEASQETSTTPLEANQETSMLTLVDEEIQSIIDDLREDPNLSSFFDNLDAELDNLDFELDNCPLW